jgi:flagellum-specific peptidoglycan hydrolase FlgJ
MRAPGGLGTERAVSVRRGLTLLAFLLTAAWKSPGPNLGMTGPTNRTPLAQKLEASPGVAVAAPAPEAPPSEPAATERKEAEATPPDVSGEPLATATPMAETDAARYLARAWHGAHGSPAPSGTLAILWAQWAHETARGRRMLAHNFAGLKGRGPDGDSLVAWTREDPQSTERVRRTFRAYRSPDAGARDYIDLLRTRYPRALRAARKGDLESFVTALGSGGYFTEDPTAYLRAISSLALECQRRGLSSVGDGV